MTGRGTEVRCGPDLRWDAISGDKSGERKDPNWTMVGQGAEEVAKELFAFKGLKDE